MSAEKNPRVSIGVPIRNGGDSLAAAMRSIINQSERDIEIIVSDNGSEDGTGECIRKLALDDPRICYFRQDPPLRAYDNFHFVLSKARGEYFMWAAHDDTRDLDFVERMVTVLQTDPLAILAFGDLNIVTPSEPDGKIMVFPFETAGLSRLRRLVKLSQMQCYYIYGVWRTAAIQRVPYAYCAWWPDLPMMLAAANLGTFLHVSGTRFNYLEVPKSNLDRVKGQDYGAKFSLPVEVAGLVAATCKACMGTGGMFIGIYAASLVIFKQLLNLPGFLYRRMKRYSVSS